MRKRLGSLFLAVIFTVCFLFGCTGKKTDEELIQERIDAFVTAYNDGDFEGVLECLDAKTRNQVEAAFNLAGGLLGGLTGFDFDLSDLFTLGVGMMSETDVIGVELSEISVDGDTAVAQGKMGFNTPAETTVQDVYFSLVKEEEDWFIQDMGDEAPQGSGSDSDNGSTSTQTGYTINTAGEFIDERAWVSYKKSNDLYYGFIDRNGKILYSEKYADQEFYNIGQGAGLIVSYTACKLIGSDGKTVATYDGKYEIKAFGGGYAFVYQNKSTITSVEHLYGVFDYTGAWVEPLENLGEAGLWNNYKYVGEGIFANCQNDNYYLENIGALVSRKIYIDNTRSLDITVKNGIVYVSSDRFYYGDQYVRVINADGEEISCVSVDSSFILGRDGSVNEIASPTWFTDGKAITKVNDYLQIDHYTLDSVTSAQFTKYSASMIQNVTFVGDYGLVELRGVDEKYYFTLIDVNGNELFEPICKDGSYSSLYLYPNGNIYWNNKHIDKTGKQTDWSGSYLFSSTPQDYIIKRVSYNDYEYYGLNGSVLFNGVKEN